MKMIIGNVSGRYENTLANNRDVNKNEGVFWRLVCLLWPNIMLEYNFTLI